MITDIPADERRNSWPTAAPSSTILRLRALRNWTKALSNAIMGLFAERRQTTIANRHRQSGKEQLALNGLRRRCIAASVNIGTYCRKRLRAESHLGSTPETSRDARRPPH